jgi:hypothetical protein
VIACISCSDNKPAQQDVGISDGGTDVHLIDGITADAPTTFTWAVSGGGLDADSGRSIAVDSEGNIFVAGIFRMPSAQYGTTTLSSKGKEDIFITKVSPSGEFLWAKSIGSADWEYGAGVAVDSNGNAFVTGGFSDSATVGSTTLTPKGSRDMFVAKLSPNGDFLWASPAGKTGAAEGADIVVDSSGNAYVTGKFSGEATFGTTTLTSNGMDDVFLAKVSTSGDFLWAKSAGGTGDDAGRGITVDANGNAHITGVFEGDVAFGSSNLSSTSQDIFVAKASATGDFLWGASGGGTDGDWADSIVVDSDGNSYVTGNFHGQATFGSTDLSSNNFGVFVAKLSPSGDFLWAKTNTGGSSSGQGIAIDSQANIYVAGTAYDDITLGTHNLVRKGSTDLFITKLSTSGEFLWATSAGGAKEDATFTSAGDIALDNGHICTTGDFRDPTTFGTTELDSHDGNEDVFIWKFEKL